MKTLIFSVSLVATAMMLGTLHAQIYADIKVSHPGIPTGTGTFRVRLDYDKAPRTCANFIGLATGQRAWLDTRNGQVVTGKKYYDGLVFHRLDHGFVLQGGDPRGNGSGGPGYVFQDEFHPSLRHGSKYIVSMANSGVCTNGSQFFITLVSNHPAASSLDDKHSVFGEVVDDSILAGSRALIDGFTSTTDFPTTGTTPDTPITIDSVTFSGPDYAGFDIHAASLLLPTVNGLNTDVAHDPAANDYKMTWDRGFQTEYFTAVSTNLVDWNVITFPFRLSMEASLDFTFTYTGVTGDRFFSRAASIDYSLMPKAPTDLTAAGNTVSLTQFDGGVVTIVFDGSGGGTWSHSVSGSGTVTVDSWTESIPSTGIFVGNNPGAALTSLARFIPQGGVQVTFDVPAGADLWNSVNLGLSFHTATSGWGTGTVNVTNPAVPPNPPTTSNLNRKIPFTFTN